MVKEQNRSWNHATQTGGEYAWKRNLTKICDTTLDCPRGLRQVFIRIETKEIKEICTNRSDVGDIIGFPRSQTVVSGTTRGSWHTRVLPPTVRTMSAIEWLDCNVEFIVICFQGGSKKNMDWRRWRRRKYKRKMGLQCYTPRDRDREREREWMGHVFIPLF